MMKVRLLVICAVIAAAAAVAADGPAYTFSMRVGNSQAEQSVSKGGGKKSKGGSTKTKTTERSLSWPVSVSVHGASRPSEDAVKLMCYFIGTTDGSPAMLGEQKVDVKFDEKGGFKTEVASPSEKLVRTTKTTTSGGGHRRGRRRGGGGSVKTTSETSGSRVTGCIIQLMVNVEVEKAYASNPGWSRLAKTNPLPESEVLKIR